MSAKIWANSKDGTIEYVSLTADKLEQALSVMKESFFIYENVSIAVELDKSPEGRKELEELSLNAARDGVSIIAVEKATGNVIGVSFNKLQVLESGQNLYFENYKSKCKESSSKALIQFMIDADAHCDLFKHLNIDCLVELMFLAVLPSHKNRGIGFSLCEASVNLVKSLNNGENVKVSLDGSALPLEPRPKAVSAIFTSFISQKIGKKLGFTKASEISYEKFEYQGKTFACRIGPSTPATTVEYLIL